MEKNSTQFPLKITKKAIDIAYKSLSEDSDGANNKYLRIAVKGGGCAGLQYTLVFVENKNDIDYLLTTNKLNILLDGLSAQHLAGATLDYVETLQGEGFKFDNPNSRKTCRCGSSFA